MLKLHLGCGNRHIPGYINIDCQRTEAADFILDIDNIMIFCRHESVDVIYICHVLEHYSEQESKLLLKKLFWVLKPGGTLRVAVPDFNEICKRYIQNHDLKELYGLLIGRHDIPYQGHKMVWDYRTLINALIGAGFNVEKIASYDQNKTDHCEIDDFSFAHLPHNKKAIEEHKWGSEYNLASLNIEAIK